MIMKKYINTFWFTLTILLCILFILLFVPLVKERIGLWTTVLYTCIALAVILSVYFIRAYIFKKMSSDDQEGSDEDK
jgi:predicted small integral membrane protein